MDSLIKLIPELKHVKQVNAIHKGYSFDKKYKVITQTGTKQVLRVASIEKKEEKQEEFNRLKDLFQLGVKISEPLVFGVLPKEELCYMLVSYIEGEDAGDLLPTYSKENQYQIGIEAGKELANIHRLIPTNPVPNWYDYKVNRYYDYLKDYKQGKTTFKQEQKILTFIEDHISLIKDRPIVFQHGDFHVWNLIVRDNVYQGAIDINRSRWGDPLHDFFKLAFFSREVSVPFSKGQIEGYFNGNVPESFWTIYCVYVAMGIISSIVWTEKIDPEGMPDMMARINQILEDHDLFQRLVPSWFHER